jgi:hypothetical protein
MKTFTIVALTLAMITAASAQTRQLPADFVGRWCIIEYPDVTYRRLKPGEACKQRIVEGTGILTVRRNGFTDHNLKCTLIEAGAIRSSYRCSEGGQSWTAEYFLGLDLDNDHLMFSLQ